MSEREGERKCVREEVRNRDRKTETQSGRVRERREAREDSKKKAWRWARTE